VVASTRPGAELHLWLPGADGALHDARPADVGAADTRVADGRPALLERVGA